MYVLDVQEPMMFVFSFSYNFHQGNVWLQKFALNLRKHAKLLFIIFCLFVLILPLALLAK